MDGTVGIRSNATSSYYLTHFADVCNVQDIDYPLNAKYIEHKDLYFSGSSVFETGSDYYLVVSPSQNHRLEVKQSDGTDAFKQLASFLFVAPPQGNLVLFLLLFKENITLENVHLFIHAETLLLYYLRCS